MLNPLLIKPDREVENINARLKHLETLDLASGSPDDPWLVKPGAEEVLKANAAHQRPAEKLAAHGEPASDPRLPIEVLNWRDTPSVEGRVLVHGRDEQSGKSYLMVESTASKIHYIPYTREMDEARTGGGLKTNSFFRLRRMFRNSSPETQIEELGNSESIFSQPRTPERKLRHLRLSGIVPGDEGWVVGWGDIRRRSGQSTKLKRAALRP